MRTEIKLSEAVGKTLEALAFGQGQVIMAFAGGTFATLGVSSDADVAEATLRWEEFGDSWLISLGVFTEEELAAKRKKMEDDWKASCDDRDRAQYERLRKKFAASGTLPE